jgi:hypothetical protein
MALEDYLETEVGIAVAATAIVLSPQVRGWLRKGAVYVVAGGIKVGDAVAGAARGVAQEAQHVTADGAGAVRETVHDTVQEARTTGRGGKGTHPKTEP